jgi:hypothetical protein
MSKRDIEVFYKLLVNFPTVYKKQISLIQRQIDSLENSSDIAINAKPKNLRINGRTGEFRGSRYRGVSVNGKSWQIFIVIDKVKTYAGSVPTQLQAAYLYDKLSIIFNGPKVICIISNI